MLDALSGLPGPLSTFLYFLISLVPLVLVHEFGHFIVAKRNGVAVEEFGVGFPPRMVKLFSRGGTDYTLNWLPLGGFVRLVGEDDPDVPGAFAAAAKKVRVAVLLAGPFSNFLLAGVIFAVVAAAGMARQVVPGIQGVSVARVAAGQPAEAAGVKPWDIIVAIDGTSLAAMGAGVKQDQDAAGGTALMTALVDKTDAMSGKPMHLTVLRGAQQVPGDWANTDAATMPGDVAGLPGVLMVLGPSKSGLQKGDMILLNQAAPTGADAPAGTDALGAGGEPVVLRNVQVVELTVTPVKSASDGKGRMGVEISPPLLPTKVSWLEAPVYGARTTVSTIGAMVGGLAAMFSGRTKLDVAGPVRIAQISKDAGQRGLSVLLGFMALLSINLGVINLLPIPALDGGRILFILVEALRGRRIEPSREAVVHLIGFALVVGLMLFVTVFEVINPGGAVRP